jgi:NAD(P)-dependent dehydrogenase (short-subunit alcohol dehydrogenase family)
MNSGIMKCNAMHQSCFRSFGLSCHFAKITFLVYSIENNRDIKYGLCYFCIHRELRCKHMEPIVEQNSNLQMNKREASMAASGCLDGKVVVVTGAGRGIGRDIAKYAAAEGAAVVVNDLGVEADGANPSTGPAADVVDEIKSAGGKAVANTDSVATPEGAENIVGAAINTFGRIDGVVNNAGILRDRIFHKMSVDDWKQVIDVHLNGAFFVSKAAAVHFREQQSGSYVHFTSTSGLIGNVGQANYSAAKIGLTGLSKSIALDMERFNVRSNCISPFAWSRMVGSVPTNTEADRARIERVKTMGTEKIAPVVVFLLSDLAKTINAQILGVRKNEVLLMSQSRPVKMMSRSEGWTPETLANHLLPGMSPSFYPLDKSADVISWDPV